MFFYTFARRKAIIMAKQILTILSLTMALTFMPCMQNTASARVELSEIEQPVKIELTGNTLAVSGAQGKVLHIYNLIGVEILVAKIDSNLKYFDLSNLPKGIYPVKVGNISKKISIQR
jgi:hypothetical protein